MKDKRIINLIVITGMVGGILASPIAVITSHADSYTVNVQSNGGNSSSQPSNSSSSSSSNSNSGAISSGSQMRTLKNSYVVYGSGASDQNELNNVLAVNGNFTKLTVNANDYKQFVNPNGSTTNAAMISSVAVTPTDPGSGIKVNIQKFNGQNNITQVTSQQYAMAAQMAGVTDVTITVTANTPVSGESALTGVYKAINADGVDLNNQNTQAANQMLGATNDAINANKGNNNYPGQLMAAVGDTTKVINQQRQNGNNPSQGDIQKMLNHRLILHGIYGSTKQHEQPIVQALVKFNNSPISSSKNYGAHVSDTIDNVKHSSGNIMNNAKQFLNSKTGEADKQQAQSWWNQLVNWVQNLFDNGNN